jgi:hypothetical protein
MLVYVLEISSDAIFRLGTHGMSAKSFIKCTELGTLYVYGSGMSVPRKSDFVRGSTPPTP